MLNFTARIYQTSCIAF